MTKGTVQSCMTVNGADGVQEDLLTNTSDFRWISFVKISILT